jgi:hypothetical protein
MNFISPAIRQTLDKELLIEIVFIQTAIWKMNENKRETRMTHSERFFFCCFRTYASSQYSVVNWITSLIDYQESIDGLITLSIEWINKEKQCHNVQISL